jgi:hypothetical protein
MHAETWIPETQSAAVEEQLHETFRIASSTGNRTPEQIERFLDGLDVVEPGLVPTPLWRPEGRDDIQLDRPAKALTVAAVARMT